MSGSEAAPVVLCISRESCWILTDGGETSFATNGPNARRELAEWLHANWPPWLSGFMAEMEAVKRAAGSDEGEAR